jgi:DDE superfamily endonuclease
VRAELPPGTPVEVWFQDEMRVGQKNKLTYRWARKGSRPRATHDQRTQSTYLFGAVCPERGTGAALVLPACNTEAMQLHLDEIATKVTPGALAILILDQAGWHGAKTLKVPRNISLLPLPPRSPELNPQGSEKHLAPAAAGAFARTQPSRKHLAIHASELVIEPSLQIVRRHCRSLLLRLEHAH